MKLFDFNKLHLPGFYTLIFYMKKLHLISKSFAITIALLTFTGVNECVCQAKLGTGLISKTKVGAWTELILNSNGTINWTEYRNVAINTGEAAIRDYLLGPKYTDYHPKPEKLPTLALQGDVDGWEGPVSMKPPACLNASNDDWYAQAGPLLYVADDPDNAGVIEAANGEMFIWRNMNPQYGFWCRLHWGDANAEGLYTFTHPVELAQFNSPRKPTAVASPTGILAHSIYVSFQNGLIGTFPVRPLDHPRNGLQYPFVQLPAGKVPMALTVTPAGEFVLAAVWDVINHKGQVAVIAVQTKVLCSEPVYQDFESCFTGTFMYGFPTWPTTKSMKLLGFVDLPVAAPTSIEAGTNLQWIGTGRFDQTVNKNLDTLLNNQNERDTWYNGSPAGYPNYKRTASAGYVMVASRSENKVVFVDLQPLLAYYRTMYFTTQARYDQTKNVGAAANQWPYTFEYSPQQKPVVAYMLDVPAPTAVAAGLSAGMCGGSYCPHCWGTEHWRATSFGDEYAYITTMDGKLLMYNIGGLNTEADASQLTLYKTINIGKNPTSISHGNGGVYKNDLFINCRGDKSVYAFNPGGEQLYVLRDSRMVDPVAVENSYNGRMEFSRYFVHVVDFSGKQVLTYVYKQDFPETMKFGAAAKVPGFPFVYQQDEVP